VTTNDTTRTDHRAPRSQLGIFAGLAALTLFAAGCSSAAAGHGSSSQAHAGGSTPAPDSAVAPPPLASPASSSAAPSSPAVAIPASCVLLTRTDARRLIAGAALDPGVDVASTDAVDYSSSCTYTAPPTAPSGQVEIFVSRGVPNALTIDRSIKRKFRTVAGIGDQTIEEPDNSNIFVRKGTLWIYLTIPFGATPATLERGARLLAARMPTA
jgi:hypothetical protein